MESRNTAKCIIWTLVALLIILHQDIWFWHDPTLLFGFLPVTLAYHMGISLAAGIVWFLAVKMIWPLGEEPTKIDDSMEGAES